MAVTRKRAPIRHVHQCNQCGYTWVQRGKKMPDSCAWCRSTRWNQSPAPGRLGRPPTRPAHLREKRRQKARS
jgi:hypothetical protein